MEWTFEPGHTAAEFSVRHMMVTYVRGHFKDIHGTLEFDPEHPERSSALVTIDTKTLWTGEPSRDEHLRGPDFLDIEKYPKITFAGNHVEPVGCFDYRVVGDLTIRGVTRKTELRVTYLGQWETSWWDEGVDKGPVLRAGFVAKTEINRHDFGVNWNSPISRNGLVVGTTVLITIDAEAIHWPKR
jgi:polyisoprenoid-binding protein YceI